MTDGDGQRVGRVVRRRHGIQAEEQLHHLLHLLLLGAAVADDGALDFGRRVLDDRHAGLDRGQHGDAARVPELQRAADVDGMEEVLDGDAVWPAVARGGRQPAWMARSFSGNDASAGVAMAPQITRRWREPSVSTQP